MKFELFAAHTELDSIAPLFGRPVPQRIVLFIGGLLSKLSSFFGIQFGAGIPHEKLPDYSPETMRAYATWKKLFMLGIADSITFQNYYDYPDEPQFFFTGIGVLGEKKRAGLSGGGRSLQSQTDSMWPSIGEAVERWALEYYEPGRKESIRAPYSAVKGSAIDIFDIAGFSQEQRTKGVPSLRLDYDDTTPFTWVQARSLIGQKDVLAPLQWFTFKHIHTNVNTKQEPLLSPGISTGAAAGQTRADAIRAGLLEVIERDAFMIYWTNKMSPEIIDLSYITEPWVTQIHSICNRYLLKPFFLHLKTDMPVHTVLCVLQDETEVGPAITVNASSKMGLAGAINSAFLGAIGMREWIRHRKEHPLSPQEASSFDISLQERSSYWYPREKIKEMSFLCEGKRKGYASFPLYGAEGETAEAHVRLLTETLRKNGYQAIYKEILDKKIVAMLGGLTVVMVRIPLFQPLHLNEDLPCLSGKRMREVPHALGFTTPKKPNALPHPFL